MYLLYCILSCADIFWMKSITKVTFWDQTEPSLEFTVTSYSEFQVLPLE